MPGGAPKVAHRDPALLGHVLDELHELTPSLLGELREHEAEHLAVVGGVDPEIGALDRLLDVLDGVLVVGLDDEQPRLGHVDPGDLL